MRERKEKAEEEEEEEKTSMFQLWPNERWPATARHAHSFSSRALYHPSPRLVVAAQSKAQRTQTLRFTSSPLLRFSISPPFHDLSYLCELEARALRCCPRADPFLCVPMRRARCENEAPGSEHRPTEPVSVAQQGATIYTRCPVMTALPVIHWD